LDRPLILKLKESIKKQRNYGSVTLCLAGSIGTSDPEVIVSNPIVPTAEEMTVNNTKLLGEKADSFVLISEVFKDKTTV